MLKIFSYLILKGRKRKRSYYHGKAYPYPWRKIAQEIYETYKPTTVEEMQSALKSVFGPLFEAALKGELDNHLGYPKNGSTPEDSKNTRNGYSRKNLKTSMGTVPIQVPRDREGTFEPQLIQNTSVMFPLSKGKSLPCMAVE